MRKLFALCLTAVLLAVIGVLVMFGRQKSALAHESAALQQELGQGPLVRVAQVKVGASNRLVALPAEVRAERKVTLYAKVSGYVKEIRVDKGDRVTRGQELAVLESPDLDQLVAAAQAELTLRKQAQRRTELLAGSGRVSQQERETAQEAVTVAETGLARARSQKEYQVLRAPFDGTVTARFADPGMLMPAATGSTTSAQPLLEVAQLDRLRVALSLGQEDAARVRVGDAVSLEMLQDEPALQARVSRISHSLDPKTRTMLCEIDLLKPPEGLYPGAFVRASMALHGPSRPSIPAEAVIAQGGNLLVALVQDAHVHFQRVKLGADDGSTIEVLDGLKGGETVALNLNPDVADGAIVRPQEPKDGRTAPTR